MTGRHVLCPVDFSDGSRTALRYAAAFSRYLDAQLTVATVNDPLLVEAAREVGDGDWPALQARRELCHFCTETLGQAQGVAYEVAVGRAAEEILALSVQLPAGLVVMGAQGLTGLRKMFFGSTTERVLRDATVPVLVTPTDPQAPKRWSELATSTRRILVPVDLGNGAAAHVRAAAALGAALHVPLLLMHAIEPLSIPMRWRAQVPNINSERHNEAEAALAMLRSSAWAPSSDLLVTLGEPAEEIVKVAAARAAGLIVMGAHSSGTGRVGSVAYRVLSLARVPVLALPNNSAQKLNALLASAPAGSSLEV